jgi:hypothetical protein
MNYRLPHARHRRQSQTDEGRWLGCCRLRRRGTGLRHPPAHQRRRRPGPGRRLHQIHPSSGIPELRQAIADKFQRENGLSYKPPRSSSPAAASTPATTPSSPPARKGTRSSSPPPTGSATRKWSNSPAPPRHCPPPTRPSSRSPRINSGQPSPRAPACSSSTHPATPPAPSTPPPNSAPSATSASKSTSSS